MPKLQSFIALETAIASRLATDWVKGAKPTVAAIGAAIERKDWTEAFRLSDGIRFDDVCALHDGYLHTMGLQALLFGASRVLPLNQTSLVRGDDIPPVLESGIKQMKVALCYSAADQVRAATRRAIQIEQILDHEETHQYTADTIQLIKASAEIESLAARLNGAVLGTGKALVNISANLTTSRLVSYGFLSEQMGLGMDTYQINEVLDERTCPVCWYMHGKTFETPNALARLHDALLKTDPEDVKAAGPFPSQSKAGIAELKAMSDEELKENGWDTPPFHPQCRGVLSLAGTVPPNPPDEPTPPEPDLEGDTGIEGDASGDTTDTTDAAAEVAALEEVLTPVPEPVPVRVTEDDFFALGEAGQLHVSQKLVDFWNRAIKQKPEDFLKSLSAGMGDKEVRPLLTDIRFEPYSGSVYYEGGPGGGGSRLSMQWNGIVGDTPETSKELFNTTRTFYFDQNESPTEVYHSYFAMARGYRGKDLGKQFLSNTVRRWQEMGFDYVTLSANIDVGSYAWARYGFVPKTAEIWREVQRMVNSRWTELQRANPGAISPTTIKTVNAALASTDPKAIWVLSDVREEVAGKPIGQHLLYNLATSWGGKLDFYDDEQMARFWAYVSKGK